MARYKETERGQGLIIPVNLYEQLVAGTYEYTLNDLIDNKVEQIFTLHAYAHESNKKSVGVKC